jgi:nucleoside 2-deoxyribosyltransferase
VTTTSIYIASASDNRAEAATCAEQLRAMGHTVTSTWHDLPPWGRSLDAARPLEEQRQIAATCMLEVYACAVVLVLSHPAIRGGLFEAGFAAGLGRKLVWVGSLEPTLFATVADDVLDVFLPAGAAR